MNTHISRECTIIHSRLFWLNPILPARPHSIIYSIYFRIQPPFAIQHAQPYNSIVLHRPTMADLRSGKWLHQPLSLYWDGSKYWCCPSGRQGANNFPWIYLQDLESATQPGSQAVAAPAQQAMCHANVATQSCYLVGTSASNDLNNRRCGLAAGLVGQPQHLPLPHQHQSPAQGSQGRLLPHVVQQQRPHHPQHMFKGCNFSQQQVCRKAQPTCKHPQFNWTGDRWWYRPGGTSCAKTCMSQDGNRQQLVDFLLPDQDRGCDLRSNLDHAVQNSLGSTVWSKMHTQAGYSGFQVICTHCGSCSFGAWRADSTPAWRDQQRANILHFLGCHVHDKLTAPLETKLPMV